MYPFLSLEEVFLDVELAQRLPRRLAYYHLALPIAQDDESITVAMVYPENQKVVSVLEAALNAKVIPVRSFAEMIRQQLDHVWQVQHGLGSLSVAYCAQSAEELDGSAPYVSGLLAALGREAQIERYTTNDFAAPPGADFVIAAGYDDRLPDSLFRTQASSLVLQRPTQLPQTILLVLRGHIPDYRALDWLVPLAHHSEAEVTLLMGVDGGARKPLVSDLSSILMGQDKRQAHLAECRRTLSEVAIAGRLKLRQEPSLSAIRSELDERHYDLVAIAAEAYGDFAQQVGAIVCPQTPAFLVIKP